MWSFINKIITFMLVFHLSDAARILAYFPIPSISHQVVFRPITQELAKRGHEVVIITPDPAFEKGRAPANITEINVHDESYQMWQEGFVREFSVNGSDPVHFLIVGCKIIKDVVDMQLNLRLVKDILFDNDKKFDLVMVETIARSSLIVSYLLKAPVIQISSMPCTQPSKFVVGAPSHPIYYPELLFHKLNNLTLFDKLNNIYTDIRLRTLMSMDTADNEMLRKNFGNNIPTIEDLENNVDMLMFNVNPIWEGNHAYPSNVVLMGGLHQKPETELPKDLKTYLDSSKYGVIYMSFGTNVDPSQLPADKIKMFNKVFSKLPYDILWKWNTENMIDKAPNVKISKWLPQSDLLRHPKVKLFITQGGLQSTDESITAGVPLIAFPMLGDQWYNAEKYVYHKIGLHMDLDTLSEQKLETALKLVLEDDSYRQNIVRLRTLMNDQPQSPLERAVWWTEYVIRHKGAKHLRSPMANISWAEYLVLDVVLFVLGVSLIVLIISVYVLYKLLKFVKGLMMQSSKLKDN